MCCEGNASIQAIEGLKEGYSSVQKRIQDEVFPVTVTGIQRLRNLSNLRELYLGIREIFELCQKKGFQDESVPIRTWK